MANPKHYSFLYRNGLSIVFLLLFFFTLLAQAVAGWRAHNQELKEEHTELIGFYIYLESGHFISATFENFESEFLQMALYVLLTVSLRQIGSAESKKLDSSEDTDRSPVPRPDSPWPVKKGGWILRLYSSSLSVCFCLLFLLCWVVHLYGSWKAHNAEQSLKHLPRNSIMAYLGQPNFWFESFQNWQSEFLSVAAIVLLTIYLRQKGSPESKAVDAPNMETGK
ncbi:MAG TPA: DUF6766 family protein [Edaphocola sp.]|nr:DUF6766 family protein [Edaphocola sp.]